MYFKMYIILSNLYLRLLIIYVKLHAKFVLTQLINYTYLNTKFIVVWYIYNYRTLSKYNIILEHIDCIIIKPKLYPQDFFFLIYLLSTFDSI